MDVKIENLFFGWHEKLPEKFIRLVNTLVLTKEREGSEGSDGDLSPRQGLQRLLPLRIWTQAFVGQAKRCTHHLWKHGLQTFDC